jgi:hypothetical protein
MHQPSSKWFSLPPLFDPREGVTIVELLRSGAGWWAGACNPSVRAFVRVTLQPAPDGASEPLSH